MEGQWPYSYRKLIKEKNLSLTLAIAIPNVLLLSQVTVISSVPTCVYESSVLESFCFWLIKACVVVRFFIFFLILAALRESEQLLIVYFLAVLGFVEGNWPSSYWHTWSQRVPLSCQGNSFCLGSRRRESDRNVLQRTKVFCCMSYKHVRGPFAANCIYLSVSESRSYTQCNIMRWSLCFWQKYSDIYTGI